MGCCDAGWAKRKVGAALLAAAKNPRRFEHRGPNAIKYTVQRKGEWVPKDIVPDGEKQQGDGDKWERWYWDDEGWLVSEGTVTLGANTSFNLIPVGGGNEFQAGTYVLIDGEALSGTFANVTSLRKLALSHFLAQA